MRTPTAGFHPDFDNGRIPYTSPVGHFAPNGYGLYDMDGNVAEAVYSEGDPSIEFDKLHAGGLFRSAFTNRSANWHSGVGGSIDFNHPANRPYGETVSFSIGIRFALPGFASPLVPPAISSRNFATANIGQSFSYQITAYNHPDSFNATGLPAGLTVDTRTGLITGVPTQTGSRVFKVYANNESGSGSMKVRLNIAPAHMPIVPAGIVRLHAEPNLPGTARPIHRVANLDDFAIDKYEVTNDRMVEVLQWAFDNGKIFLNTTNYYLMNSEGSPQWLYYMFAQDQRIRFDGTTFTMKAAQTSGYPCSEVTWYGAVAFCNFLTEMEGSGRTPCYDLNTWTCDWTATGYRLPTEAEWEKAARGGLVGARFPWGDTITHSNANYRSREIETYDLSPTRDYHPDFLGGRSPRTSPVGYFPPNGYGLYDMAGNAAEWVWDRYTVIPEGSEAGTLFNPTGPQTGDGRVIKGGHWRSYDYQVRASSRAFLRPERLGFHNGFRTVLPSVPSE